MHTRQPEYPRLFQQRAKAPAGGFGWQIGCNEIRHVKSLLALIAAVINGKLDILQRDRLPGKGGA
jgi:hypothetical protein